MRGFLWGRNGFREVFSSVSECAVSDSAGVIEAVVEAAPTLGSMEDVVDVVVTLSAAVCAGLVCAVAIREVAEICGGGNLVKKRRSRGCSDCASWTCLSMAVGVQYTVYSGMVLVRVEIG